MLTVCAILNTMNAIQQQLLKLADTVDLGKVTYYKLSKDLQVDHPFKVKYALDQLVKKGHLLRNLQTGSISTPKSDTTSRGLINIPYYGEVNCGEALTFADNEIKSYLRLSPSVMGDSSLKGVFALKAVGKSMNEASINGKPVYEGDYVIAKRAEAYSPKNGDYVISVIWGAANLKQFHRDSKNRQILLMSQSSDDLPPIVISEQDADEIGAYFVAARAIDVIPVSI